jgi:hypothetical protein
MIVAKLRGRPHASPWAAAAYRAAKHSILLLLEVL